jgi:thioredoxin 1
MNRTARSIVRFGKTVFLAGVLTTLVMPGCSSEAGKAVTLTTRNFEEIVLSSKQPVLVDFWADWCGPCRSMDPVIKDLASEFEGRAVVAKLNVDDYKEIAERYGIDVLPTYLVFKAGEPRHRVMGVKPKQYMRDLLGAMQ